MTKDDEVSMMAVVGVILTIAGLALLSWGWLFDATIDSGVSLYGLDSDRTYNIGLVTTKLSLLITGGSAFAAGIAALAARSLVDAIKGRKAPLEDVPPKY